jgi:hypothetical protein
MELTRQRKQTSDRNFPALRHTRQPSSDHMLAPLQFTVRDLEDPTSLVHADSTFVALAGR